MCTKSCSRRATTQKQLFSLKNLSLNTKLVPKTLLSVTIWLSVISLKNNGQTHWFSWKKQKRDLTSLNTLRTKRNKSFGFFAAWCMKSFPITKKLSNTSKRQTTSQNYLTPTFQKSWPNFKQNLEKMPRTQRALLTHKKASRIRSAQCIRQSTASV